MTMTSPASDPSPETASTAPPAPAHLTESDATAIDRLTVAIHQQFKRVVLLSVSSTVAVVVVALVSMLLVARNGQIAERQEHLVQQVERLTEVQLRTLQAAEESRTTARETREEVEASPKLEVKPATKRGELPQVTLVVPARPARPATPATPTAPSSTAAGATSAVSIPIPLPSGATITSTGAGP